jgi:hypothetical protein
MTPPITLSGVRWCGLLAGTGYRSCRVLALLAAIVMLSLADLLMTLTHLTHYGMIEANPVARGIMRYGSPAILVAWKLATVGLAVGILFWARRRRAAELAAAFCCCVLLWLTARWSVYNGEIAALPDTMLTGQIDEGRWVTMIGADEP